MRFHMGVSFSWRTIKKFLFPILIGILFYIAFFISDIKSNTVNALENYDTTFTFHYRDDVSYLIDTKLDDTHTYRNFFDNLNSISSNYYNILIWFAPFSSYGKLSISGYRIYFIPKEVSSLSSSLFADSTYFNIRFNYTAPKYVNQYLNSSNVGNDIFSSQMYLDIVNCLENNSCTSSYIDNSGSLSSNFSIAIPINNVSINNNNSFDVFSPAYNGSSSLSVKFLYSSNVPIYISNDYNLSSNNTFYKKLMFYDKELTIGDYFPTYKDYIDSLNNSSNSSSSNDEDYIPPDLIYIPDDSFTKSCVVVYDKDTIRAYSSLPEELEAGDTYNYRDYYINSHYIYKDSSDIYSSDVYLGSCIDETKLTSMIYYRNDFFEILAIFVILVCCSWYLVAKLYKILFRGGKVF